MFFPLHKYKQVEWRFRGAPMEKIHVTCTVFMDGICLQVPTRWKLRRAIKKLNAVFTTLKIEKHPDKTEMGRVERGFDFLGYHYSSDGLSVAKVTLERCSAKIALLYEQRANREARQQYVRRFVIWLYAGVRSVLLTESKQGAGVGVKSLTANLEALLGPSGLVSAHGLRG